MGKLVGNCPISIDAQGTFRMPDDYWNACTKPFYAAPGELGMGHPHLSLWPGYLAAVHDGCLEPTYLDMDARQHVTVPLELLAAAGIQPNTDACLIGNSTHLEMWNPATWDSFVSEMHDLMEGLLDDLD